MSVAHTRSTPPPTHAECTADITGFGHLAQAGTCRRRNEDIRHATVKMYVGKQKAARREAGRIDVEFTGKKGSRLLHDACQWSKQPSIAAPRNTLETELRHAKNGVRHAP